MFLASIIQAVLLFGGTYAVPGCRKDASLRFDPFNLFPPDRQWKHISKTIKDPKQIDRYVEFYIDPFRQVQRAERNLHIHLKTIQQSLLKALELSIRCVDELRMTKKEYEGRKQEDYGAACRRSLTILEGSEVKKIHPILKTKSLRRFMLQRMDDMLWGTTKYSEMQAERRRFIRNTKRLYRKVQKANLYVMRHVVKKTLDLEEVKRSLVRDIKRFHHEKETSKGGTFKRLVWKIKGTGDDAARPLPATCIVLVVTLTLSVMLSL